MTPEPLVFLSLNDRLDEAECRTQVRRLAANGWGGFYMHVRWGMAEAFLGPRFMRAIQAMVDEAAICGLKAWLYDEDRWPSGSGGGLAGLDPALRQRHLVRRAPGWQLAENETLVHADASGTYVQFVPGIDASRAPGGCIGDLLNLRTTRRLISEAYEPYVAAVGHAFGGTVPGIFMDEPNVIYYFTTPCPALPWTEGMLDLYRARWDEDLLPLLPALYADLPASPRARYRFRRLVEERLVEAFFKPLHDWCTSHRLEFVGHLACEESLSSLVTWSGISAAAYPWFHVPGVDMLGRKIDENATLKTCVGAARQLARPAQSELFGLAGAGAAPEDLRWIADWHLALGVTRFCSHLVHHSLRGRRKEDCLPSIHSHQPYAAAIPQLTERLAGLAKLLDEGQPVCEIALLHPFDSAWLVTQPIPSPAQWFDHHPSAIHELQDSYLSTLEAVLGHPRDMDCLSEPLLHGPGAPGVTILAGALRVGAATYRALVLPRLLTLRPATLELLVQAGEAGVALIITAPLPTLIEGAAPTAAQRGWLARLTACVRTSTVTDLGATLDRLVPPVIKISSADAGGWLRCHERVLARGRRLFIHHGDRRQGCTVEIRAEGPACVVDPVSGAAKALEAQDCVWRLALAPGGAVLLEFGTARTISAAAPAMVARRQPISGWHGRALGANALRLSRCAWRTAEDAPWSEPLASSELMRQLVARDHVGPLELRFTCHSQLRDHTGLRLLVEEAGRYRIRVNGVPVHWDGSSTWLDPAFQLVSAGQAFITGENHVDLRCEFSVPRLDSPAYQPRRLGIEIEPICVLGDFAVSCDEVWPAQAGRDYALTGRPPLTMYDARIAPVLHPPAALGEGDLARQGLAHYAGEVALDTSAHWAGGTARFSLASVEGGVVRLLVDGVDRGLLAWSPWNWELGELAAGEHRFTLIIANTLRNLLSSHFREQGDERVPYLATAEGNRRIAAHGYAPDAGGLPEGRVRLDAFGIGGASLDALA